MRLGELRLQYASKKLYGVEEVLIRSTEEGDWYAIELIDSDRCNGRRHTRVVGINPVRVQPLALRSSAK